MGRRRCRKRSYTLWTLQRACDVQVAGAALGAAIPIAEDVQQRCADDSLKVTSGPEFGLDVFEAMVRLVDRKDRGWRE